MHIAETQILSPDQKAAIFMLWNNEYPVKLNYNSPADFDAYLENLPEQQHYILLNDQNAIQGWAFTFVRNDERWFAIIVDSSIHKQSHGTSLLNRIKQNEAMLHGWVADHNNDLKSDGTAYSSPLAFYLKNGFTLCSDTRLETEKLSAVKITWKKN